MENKIQELIKKSYELESIFIKEKETWEMYNKKVNDLEKLKEETKKLIEERNKFILCLNDFINGECVRDEFKNYYLKTTKRVFYMSRSSKEMQMDFYQHKLGTYVSSFISGKTMFKLDEIDNDCGYLLFTYLLPLEKIEGIKSKIMEEKENFNHSILSKEEVKQRLERIKSQEFSYPEWLQSLEESRENLFQYEIIHKVLEGIKSNKVTKKNDLMICSCSFDRRTMYLANPFLHIPHEELNKVLESNRKEFIIKTMELLMQNGIPCYVKDDSLCYIIPERIREMVKKEEEGKSRILSK